MKVNQLIQDTHAAAKAKGWYDTPREVGTLQMLIVSEMVESFEEVRKDRPQIYLKNIENGDILSFDDFDDQLTSIDILNEMHDLASTGKWKPEGEFVEIADAVIRIADYLGHRECPDFEAIINMKMVFNETRAYRHGNQRF